MCLKKLARIRNRFETDNQNHNKHQVEIITAIRDYEIEVSKDLFRQKL